VAAVAKALGALWKELADAQRRPYHDRAAQERARVQAHVFERQQKEKTNTKNLTSGADSNSTSPFSSSSNKRGSSGSDDHLVLPLAKVKKICKLDPDVRGLSREAVAAIARASELVLARLGCEAVKVASMQNRRTLLPDDVVVVCQNREQFSFLREDLVDLARHQHQQKLDHANSKSKAGSSSSSSKKSAPVDAEEDGDVAVDDEDEDHHTARGADGNDENRAAASKQKQQRPTVQPPPPPPSSTKPLTAYFARSGGSSASSEPLTK
jgi:histone H3/H4